MKNIKGFTLVEAMLAMAIVLFVVISILSGFTQQMVANRFAGSKNIAISLAESKLEDYLKYPAAQMPGNSVDYVVESNKRLVVSTANPGSRDQFRRSTTVAPDPANPTMNQVTVTVEYGMRGSRYPFRVVLTSTRGG